MSIILKFFLILLASTKLVFPMHDKGLLELVENRIAHKKDLNIGLHFNNQRKRSLLCLAAEKKPRYNELTKAAIYGLFNWQKMLNIYIEGNNQSFFCSLVKKILIRRWPNCL